ncbi:CPBP family intramembrane glutamic endopeptidase [Puerhibacterium sp. TATVAM-FAB25]|uniref:CPBP family intramembrane glutamic endopeptidase n=1 Tax=Puerhibacterium sp. TATVAM-FAB25 TaxID=3093699 RepID=UPI00397BD323
MSRRPAPAPPAAARAPGASSGAGTPAGRRGPVVFVVLAFALAWLAAAPLYATGGLASPYFLPVSLLVMTTPAIAALVTVRWVEGDRAVWSRLGAVSRGRSAAAVLGWSGVAFGVLLGTVLVALLVGALLGVYPADVTGLSGLRAVLDAQLEAAGAPPVAVPLGVVLVGQVAGVVVGSVVNTVPAAGEELGWRGYLFPRLLPLGAVPAVLVSGVVWGLWHAPLVLLGYNYPGAHPVVALAAMCGMCTVVGGLLAWLRQRSGSVWPAALGHGTLNAAAGLSVVLARAGEPVDTVHATVLGWSGWIVPAVVLAVLVGRGALRPRVAG